MLVLSRRPGEHLVVGRTVGVTVLGIKGNRVRLGVRAPEGVPVYRTEIAPVNTEMTEFTFLLPSGHAAAFEGAARARGLSAGRLLREVVQGFLEQTGRAPDIGATTAALPPEPSG